MVFFTCGENIGNKKNVDNQLAFWEKKGGQPTNSLAYIYIYIIYIFFLILFPSLSLFFSFSFSLSLCTMIGANLSDQIPGGPNLTLTLTLNSK